MILPGLRHRGRTKELTVVITAREHRDRIARAVVGQRLRAARTVGQTLSEPLGRSFSLVTGLLLRNGWKEAGLEKRGRRRTTR
jgi:hypothetical protein